MKNITKKICALLTAGCMLFGTAVAVSAADLEGSVSYKKSERNILFTGTSIGARQNVTLQVQNLTTGKIIAILQEKSNEKGEFEFVIPFAEAGTGTLEFIYNCEDNETAKIVTVYFDESKIPDDPKEDDDPNNGGNGNNNGGSGTGGSTRGGGGGGRGNRRSDNTYLGISYRGTTVKADPLEFTGYSDVASDHWAKTSIDNLTQKGVLNGVGNNAFAPDEAVTREQFVKMVVAAFDIELITEGDLPFADTQAGEWYYDYLRTGFKYGIINGKDETTFGTGEQITRQDACVILQNTADIFGVSLEQTQKAPFADNDQIADYAKDSVTAMYQAGIIVGISEDIFAPTDSLTRAMAAVLLDRML